MSNEEFHILCPIRGPLPFVACPAEEVSPLIEHLKRNVAVGEPTEFPRGIILPDGRLDLCKQNLGPEGCRRVTQALQNNQQVRSVLLGTDGIGDAGAASLSELLITNSSIEIVYLGCNGITADGAESLAAALSQNTNVHGLWLKRNPIGDRGVEAIARLLRRNHAIRVLDLVNTGIGLRGIQSLCHVLKYEKCSIERLYLGGNSLDEESAAELALMLRHNNRLQSLLLNVGCLGDHGTNAIAEGLKENTTLRELGLASNGVTARGSACLMSALTSHPSLVHLDLGYSPSTKVLGARGNALGDEGGQLIASMLQSNNVLTRINLARTGIGKRGLEAIERALLKSRSIQHCVLDGGLSETVRFHLISNQQKASLLDQPSLDVTLIRSVFRTAK